MQRACRIRSRPIERSSLRTLELIFARKTRFPACFIRPPRMAEVPGIVWNNPGRPPRMAEVPGIVCNNPGHQWLTPSTNGGTSVCRDLMSVSGRTLLSR